MEQLLERTSTQTRAIVKLQQEVKVFREQVSGLESAVLSLVSPQATPEDRQDDCQTVIPDINCDITSAIASPPDGKYFYCPECLSRGWSEESFRLVGKTKA